MKIASANINKFCIERDLYLEDIPIVNTPILGVLTKALDSIDLESMKKAIIKVMGEKKGESNSSLAEEAAKLTMLLNF